MKNGGILPYKHLVHCHKARPSSWLANVVLVTYEASQHITPQYS